MHTMDFNKGKSLPMKSSLRRWSMVSGPICVFREAEPVVTLSLDVAFLRVSAPMWQMGPYRLS
jgi:hypothetical protein